MKRLRFYGNLPELILEGSKTSTWRINDEKGIKVDDALSLCRGEDYTEFAKAKVMHVTVTTFGNLSKEDKEGHEEFNSEAEMYEIYSGYYGFPVGPETELKIIKFKLL